MRVSVEELSLDPEPVEVRDEITNFGAIHGRRRHVKIAQRAPLECLDTFDVS